MKKNVKFTLERPRRSRGEVEIQLYSFTLTLDWDGWYTTWPGLFTPRKEIRRPCAGDWVDPRTSLDGYGKSGPTGIGSPKCPARSESLSWPT